MEGQVNVNGHTRGFLGATRPANNGRREAHATNVRVVHRLAVHRRRRRWERWRHRAAGRNNNQNKKRPSSIRHMVHRTSHYSAGRTDGAWVVHRPPQLACTVRAPPSPEALAAAPAPSAARRETTDTRTAARLPTAGSRWGPSERVFWGPPLVACGQWEAWGRRPPHGGLVRRVTASALALGW